MRYATMAMSTMLLAAALAFAQGTPPAGGAAAPAAPAGEGPTEVVQTAAQGMLGELDKYLLPHFDTERAARGVLGQHWRTATPEQRKRFIDAFYHSLLNNYGAALVDFTSDRLKIFPTSVDPNAKNATVRTEVKRSNGDRVSVNYYLFKTPEGWKAWDVVIDGISYVNSYRTDFGEQIEQQGIDSVIKRLESGEKPSAIG